MTESQPPPAAPPPPSSAPPLSSPPPPPSSAPPPPGWNSERLTDYRHLRRSRTDRKVAGVAGGLGQHLAVDPTVLRVLFVVLAFFGGAGILVYGAMWLVVPDEGTDRGAVSTSDGTRNTVLLVVLAIAVLAALADALDGNVLPWPLAVGALVLLAIWLSRDTRRGAEGPEGVDGLPAHTPPGSTSGGATLASAAPVASAGSEPTVVLDKAAAPPAGPPPPAWAPPSPAPPPARPAPRRSGPLLFLPALALVVLALGTLGLADSLGADIASPAYPALALTVVGTLLVVGSAYGRPGGLVLLGVVAALALAMSAIVDPGYRGSRDLTYRPTDAASVLRTYDVPAGRILLDLRGVEDLEALDGRSVALSGHAGELQVLVPPGLGVQYAADIDFGGQIDVGDRRVDGWSPEVAGLLPDTRTGDSTRAGTADAVDTSTEPTVILNLDLDFGHVEVARS